MSLRLFTRFMYLFKVLGTSTWVWTVLFQRTHKRFRKWLSLTPQTMLDTQHADTPIPVSD